MKQESLYDWEDSVASFFVWCSEHLELDEYRLELMQQVIKTEDDLGRFIELFDGDIDHLETTFYKMLA